MARIVVTGYMIRHPLAGNILAYFHYLLGFHRLGHEVFYLEESGWPQSCYDPVSQTYGNDPQAGLSAVRKLMMAFGTNVPVCYVNRDSGDIKGTDLEDVKRMLRAADLLLNIGGVCWLPEFRLCRRLALIDMDPLFTQIGQFAAEGLNDHHIYFSYGGNIGQSGCKIPTRGLNWLPTVPPVVPEIWESAATAGKSADQGKGSDAPFTTVANWNAYGSVNYLGNQYGQKDQEFIRLLDLPKFTSQRLELALSGCSSEMKECLRSIGWSVRDGGELSTSLLRYQDYITHSRGEFSAAKQAYVKTHSGWFSDRSVCYLAAGCPVILQDTGFSEWLPTGQGVLPYSSIEEAADCIERANAEYTSHCFAAREVAEQTFSYKVVLPRLLDVALGTGTSHQSVIKNRIEK